MISINNSITTSNNQNSSGGGGGVGTTSNQKNTKVVFIKNDDDDDPTDNVNCKESEKEWKQQSTDKKTLEVTTTIGGDGKLKNNGNIIYNQV